MERNACLFSVSQGGSIWWKSTKGRDWWFNKKPLSESGFPFWLGYIINSLVKLKVESNGSVWLQLCPERWARDVSPFCMLYNIHLCSSVSALHYLCASEALIFCFLASKVLPTVFILFLSRPLCFPAAFVVDTWLQRHHIWIKLFLYLLLNSQKANTFTAVTLRAAWPIHCMMTMQFTKLQASWNPALKKPQTLPELLIDYWWRPDKCTRLTVPMTFLPPALGHFSACLYVSVSWYKSLEDVKCAHLNHKR